jgi:hypothetical protein
MAIEGAAFLLAIGQALARIHVEHDGLRRLPPVHLADPLTGKIGERGKILEPAQPLRLEHPIWLAGATEPEIARSPTTRRIAGSWHSLSPSFTSS